MIVETEKWKVIGEVLGACCGGAELPFLCAGLTAGALARSGPSGNAVESVPAKPAQQAQPAITARPARQAQPATKARKRGRPARKPAAAQA